MVSRTNRLIAAALVLTCLAATCIFTVEPAKGQTQGSWTTMAPLPEPLYQEEAAVVNGMIYVIGMGSSNSSGGWDDFFNFQYDPTLNTWQSKPIPIHGYRAGFKLAVYQDKIYVIGGWNAGGLSTWVYDPSNDTWTEKSSVYTNVGLEANVVDGKVYFISGFLPMPFVVDTQDTNMVYDLATNNVSEMAPIPVKAVNYASAVLDGKIYIIGGADRLDQWSTEYNVVQIFDPKTNNWTKGTSMPIGVIGAAAIATTGAEVPKRIYVVGGEIREKNSETGNITNLIQVYDPETGSWSVGAPMPTAREYHAMVNINDTIYAVGGRTPSDSQANEKYLPLGDSSPQTPTPSASPSPNPISEPSPTVSPERSPSMSPSPSLSEPPSPSASPTPSASPQQANLSASLVFVTASAAIIIVIAVITTAVFKRRKGKT